MILKMNQTNFWPIFENENKKGGWTKTFLNDFKKWTKKPVNEIYFWTILENENKKIWLNKNFFERFKKVNK